MSNKSAYLCGVMKTYRCWSLIYTQLGVWSLKRFEWHWNFGTPVLLNCYCRQKSRTGAGNTNGAPQQVGGQYWYQTTIFMSKISSPVMTTCCWCCGFVFGLPSISLIKCFGSKHEWHFVMHLHIVIIFKLLWWYLGFRALTRKRSELFLTEQATGDFPSVQ